jgi:hypothetical protein
MGQLYCLTLQGAKKQKLWLSPKTKAPPMAGLKQFWFED